MKKKAKKTKKKSVVKKAKRPAVKARTKKKPASAKKIKKTVKKAAKPKTKAKSNKPIGVVTHFYNEISVAIVRFKENVPQGTVLYFHGATTDFKHPVKSMQYNHESVAIAPKGKQIGIKVPKRVREGDKVHRA